jgi:hypothetical protein
VGVLTFTADKVISNVKVNLHKIQQRNTGIYRAFIPCWPAMLSVPRIWALVMRVS